MKNIIINKIIPAVLLVVYFCIPSFSQVGKNPLPTPQDYCEDFRENTNGTAVTVTMSSDKDGCFIEINYNHVFPPDNMAAKSFPHGLDILLKKDAVFTGSLTTTGDWFSLSTTNPSFTNTNMRWKGEVTQGWPDGITPPNSIPSNTHLTIKKYINVTAGVTTFSIDLYELSGGGAGPGPDFDDRTLCHKQFTFNTPSVNITVQADTLCKNTSTMLTLEGIPQSKAAYVSWYKYEDKSCVADAPSTNLFSNLWMGPYNVGGLNYNTNPLSDCTWYVAEVNDGCLRYYSAPIKITICPGTPGVNAQSSITPAMGFTALVNNRACEKWSGTLRVMVAASPCRTNAPDWVYMRNQTGVWNPILSSWTKSWNHSTGESSLTVNNLLLLDSCTTRYDFEARLKNASNACGGDIIKFTIFIDGPAKGGKITTLTGDYFNIGTGTNTAPILCYNTGTQLQHKTDCGTIKYWQYREAKIACTTDYTAWTTLDVTKGTSIWWTNPLKKTTQFRAYVENGACVGNGIGVYSKEITVFVKPLLTVGIKALSGLLICPGSGTTLKAIPYPGSACAGSVKWDYQWYHNGLAIGGATAQTYNAIDGGNYTVEVIDSLCGKAISDVITLCMPDIQIGGPCCICEGMATPEVIQLRAEVSGGCGGLLKGWQWFYTNEFGVEAIIIPSDAPFISVQRAGIYRVRVNLGACELGDSIRISPCLR